MVETGMLEEELGLGGTAGTDRPEMIGSCTDAMFTGLSIVTWVEFIANGNPLGALDIDKRYGIICRTFDIVATSFADMGDTQLVPLDR